MGGSRRILLVGHNGFIGRHLHAALTRTGFGAEVVGISMPEYDLTRQSCVEALIPLFDTDTTIVFLAGIKRQQGDSLDAFQANIGIATTFCRCLQHGRVRRVIYMSSAAVYGEEHANPTISEETLLRPTSLYGVAKATSETLLEHTMRTCTSGELAIVRPPLIYGPGDTTNSYGPTSFARAAIRRVPITLWGDGSERREFLFVDDAVRLIAGLIDHPYTGALNLASGRSHTYRVVVGEISTLLGRPVTTSGRSRTKPQVDHAFANARLREVFSEFRFTTLREGLERTLAHEEAPV